MTFPIPLEPPQYVGSQPRDATEVNAMVGQHLRSFVTIKNSINQDAGFLLATELTAAPYYFTADQETLIKSAIAGLDTSLDAVDMTFINRLVGLY
jgi:hypothetical protein